MGLYDDIQRLLKTSENSVETAKAALEVIHGLHCKYCELFRNEIDNIWGKEDGRYKMLSELSKASAQFRAIVEFDRQQKKLDKKTKETK